MFHRFGAACVAAVFIALPVSIPASAEEPTAEQLVNGLQSVFGEQPGKRRGHAKGYCVKGDFTPDAQASSLSKAPHFAKTVAIFGRFSMGGGNPQVPDTTKGAVRGLAVRFDPEGKSPSDLVMISAPIHFAKDGAQMLGFLKVVATGPDPEKMKAFMEANPEVKGQGAWLDARPVPASYAGVNYYGVHAFTFTNAAGAKQIIKYKATPLAGEVGLTDDEAKAKSPDFYKAELTERLGKGPASFELTAILAEGADATDNPSALWADEDKHKTAKLGLIKITAIEPDATCDAVTLDPANLPDGIEGPANDKIFALRSEAYAISLSRRSAQ